MVKPWSLAGLSLYVCPASLSSHLGCMLSHHQYIDIFPNTPWVKCRRLESKIRAVMLSVVHVPHLGFTSRCGTIATTFSQVPGRDSQDLRSFSLVLTTSRLGRQMHVVGSVKHERPSLQQMAKWRNLPGVVHWAFTSFCHHVHGFTEEFLSFFVTL